MGANEWTRLNRDLRLREIGTDLGLPCQSVPSTNTDTVCPWGV